MGTVVTVGASCEPQSHLSLYPFSSEGEGRIHSRDEDTFAVTNSDCPLYQIAVSESGGSSKAVDGGPPFCYHRCREGHCTITVGVRP